MPQPLSSSSVAALEARVRSLETKQGDLQLNLRSLTQKYDTLSNKLHSMKERDRPLSIESLDSAASHDQALQVKQKLNELSGTVQKSGVGDVDEKKTNSTPSPKAAASSYSVPPHLRGKSNPSNGTQASHANGKAQAQAAAESVETGSQGLRSPLVTDGPVDTAVGRSQSSSISSTTMAQPGHSKSNTSSSWKPYFITTLKPFTPVSLPAASEMVTFHPEFLSQQLRGTDWSPGFHFVPPSDTTCMLPSRSYYLVDPAYEPYLPSAPGDHGAKLTAFFNANPEDVFEDLPKSVKSYMKVPLFVLKNGRYTYYGNYSQTRWSDKLGYDTMKTQVPQSTKEFWAKELASPVRRPWVTEELKKHFVPKPGYEGRMFAKAEDGETAGTEEEDMMKGKMERDVKRYVMELREWEREANLKIALLTQKVILDAFDATDAEDPPALRLWWEYLECVEWRKDFYDLLVTLQSREAKRYLH